MPDIVSCGFGKTGGDGKSKEGLPFPHFGLAALRAGMGVEHTVDLLIY